MEQTLLFDVDGTLTPSRGRISDEIKSVICELLAKHHNVFLVSGSDSEKTIEQIGYDLWSWVNGVFQCAGNEFWSRGFLVKRTGHRVLIPELEEFLGILLRESKYPLREGRHIEARPGMVNFSIVGRNATKEQRDEYERWDYNQIERESLCERIMDEFSGLSCSVGGQISVDIYSYGFGKEQVVKEFPLGNPIAFFGDRCRRYGNDSDLADEISKRFDGSRVYHVAGPDHTLELLKRDFL